MYEWVGASLDAPTAQVAFFQECFRATFTKIVEKYSDCGGIEARMEILSDVDDFVWGPLTLALFLGTGVFLTVRTRFLCWRNLGWALKKTFSREIFTQTVGDGDISPFAALSTMLAATIGTGNIVGVATAMVSGGPGALVWMCICSLFGMTTSFGECMLAIKYREVNKKGEISGGPMYTMKNALQNKTLGRLLGGLFALFTVTASFGIGNMTQANSISSSLQEVFDFPIWITGIALCSLSLLMIVGGIRSISKAASILVPFMAAFYIFGGILVILGNRSNLPQGLSMIFRMAFSPRAVGGGLAGTVTASMATALRYGVSRGVFSNEAGMGSAAITAATASTDNPVHQGYISMTSVFWDTIVVCTITGLAIASSGVLGSVNPATGELYQGGALTIAAFETVLGPMGGYLISCSITLFAFATILGWEYQGEKAMEYLCHTHKYNLLYRIVFCLIAYVGATATLEAVWNFSDIANALMAVPNLVCLLMLSGEIAGDIRKYGVVK